jgi:hypothetical protein
MLELNDVIELAHGTARAPEFYPRLLHLLQGAFQCQVAALHVTAAYPVTGGGPLATLGFDPEVRRARARRWGTYLDELEPIAHVALGSHLVTTDRVALSTEEGARRAVYREFVEPQGIGETLVGYLCLQQRPIAALSLGRRGGERRRAPRLTTLVRSDHGGSAEEQATWRAMPM